MGVAPGVKSEFWEWPGQDFCGDLMNYTATLLSGDDWREKLAEEIGEPEVAERLRAYIDPS